MPTNSPRQHHHDLLEPLASHHAHAHDHNPPHHHAHHVHFEPTHACHGHSHARCGGDFPSNANAILEFITTAANAFNFVLYAYDLMQDNDEEPKLASILALLSVSMLSAIASWYTHLRSNQYFETKPAQLDQEDSHLHPEMSNDSPPTTLSVAQCVALGVDAGSHVIEYASSLISSVAFFNDIRQSSVGLRISLMILTIVIGIGGTYAPIRNETIILKAHNARKSSHGEAANADDNEKRIILPPKGDLASYTNALVEFVTTAADTFNFGIYAHQFLNAANKKANLPAVLALGVVLSLIHI